MEMIALMGFKGAGKDTLADYFVELGYEKFSFADTVKDALSAIFSWDRELLDGTTVESREWREQTDEFWSKALGIANFTPRFAMVHFGTDIMRHHFHQEIWILALKKKILGKKNVVVTDCRFLNEIEMMRAMGATLIRVDKGDFPEFWDVSKEAAAGYEQVMRQRFPSIHRSEWEWNQVTPDYIVRNDGDKEEVRKQAELIFNRL